MLRYESAALSDSLDVMRRLRDGLRRYPGVCVDESLFRHVSAYCTLYSSSLRVMLCTLWRIVGSPIRERPRWKKSLWFDSLFISLRVVIGVDVSMFVCGSSDVCICGSLFISWCLGSSGSSYAM